MFLNRRKSGKLNRGKRAYAGLAVFFVLQALVILGLNSIASGTIASHTLQPSSKDSFMDETRNGDKNGALTTMTLRSSSGDGDDRLIIQRDIAAIPAGVLIEDAQLQLYMSTAPAASRTDNIHRIGNFSWIEADVSWDSRTNSIDWPGTDGAANEYAATPTASAASGTTPNVWLSFNVTADVLGFYNGTYTNNGWVVKDNTENSGTSHSQIFATKENGTAANRPKLVVTYVKGTTTVTPTSAFANVSQAFNVVMTNTGGADGDQVHQVNFTIPAGYTNIPTTVGGYTVTATGGKAWTVTGLPAGTTGPQTVIATATSPAGDITNGETVQVSFTVTTPIATGATNWSSGITGAFGGTFNPAAQVVTIQPNLNPDTSITDPTGGTLTGSSKLITGTASDDTSVNSVAVAISRNAGGLYWNGSGWVAGPIWNPATITSGSGTPSASWQYSWSLPSDNGGGYNVQARATDNLANNDPTPANVAVSVDNTPPQVTTFSINSGAVYTATSTVTLNNNVTGAAEMRFAETTATLAGASYAAYAATPGFNLSAGDGSKTVYAQYRDSAGNETTPAAANTFDSIIKDTTAPTVGTVSPPNGSSFAGPSTTVTASFIEANEIDTTSVVSGGFYLLDNTNTTVTASVTYDSPSKIATLTPSAPLTGGVTYQARLTTAIKDAAGNNISSLYSWFFTVATATALDTSITDPTGGTLTGSNKLVTGTATDETSVDSVYISIRRNSDSLYANGAGGWIAGPNWIPATITSGQGTTNAAWQYDWELPSDDGGSYTMEARAIDNGSNIDPTPASVSVNVDNTQPTINSVRINSDANYATTRTVTLNSDVTGANEMRFAETTAALSGASWASYAASSGFVLSLGDGPKTVFAQYRDSAGNATAIGVAGSFDTIVLDTTRPVVVSTFPAGNATETSVLVVVTGTFTEANQLDAATINNGTFYLKDPLNNTVAASISYNSAAKIAQLTPNVPLSYDTTYTAHMTTSIADLAGFTLATEKIWSFKTTPASSHPPGAPSSLAVNSDHLVNKLDWTPPSGASDSGGDFDPTTGNGGYNIYRSDGPAGPWTKINGALTTASAYNDNTYVSKGIYYYKVRAVDLGGSESADSGVADNRHVSMTRTTSTSAPVAYEAANGAISFTVPPQGAAVGVSIRTETGTIPSGIQPITAVYDLTPNGTTFSPPGTLTFETPGNPTGAKIQYWDGTVWKEVTGGTYSYDTINRTIGYDNITHFSFYTVTNTSDTTPPSAPATETLSSPGAGQVTINWGPAVDNESGISGYIIYRSLATFNESTKNTNTVIVAMPGNVLTYLDNSVQSGETYFYGVTAENGAGLEGPLSNIASILVSGKTPPHFDFTTATSQCPRCHAVHKSPAQKRIFRLFPEIETCFVCHDGTGSDFDIRTKWEGLAAHDTSMTASPDTNIKCVRCHNPHGIYVGIRMTRLPEETLCFKCHNYAGSTRNGWNPQQQFSDTDTTINGYHAIKGTTKDGLTGAKIECTSCHNPMVAQRGTLGSDYTVRDADPFNTFNLWRDNTRETSATYTGFCLNCHKAAPWPEATGTASVFVPYTIAFPNVPVASYPFFTGWDKSAFRDSNSRHFEMGLTCQRCHIPHGSRNRRNMAWTYGAYYYSDDPTVSKEENLCYQCHKPSPLPEFSTAPNIFSEFAKTSRMPITNSDIHWDTETSANLGYNGGSPNNRHVECYDCHDPHKAKSGNRGQNNLAGPPLTGARGVSVVNGAAGTIPTYTPTVITYEYELCFKCHSSYTTRPLSLRYFNTSYNGGGAFVQGDKGLEYNTNNSSFMPVPGPGHNKSTRLNSALLGGLTVNSTISCTDCHNNDITSGNNDADNDEQGWVSRSSQGPKGPHGSPYAPVLRANYRLDIADPGGYSASDFALCFLCHNSAGLFGTNTNFTGSASRGNLHQYHMQTKGVAGCRNCHYNVHSNQQANNTIYRIIESSGTFDYTTPPPPSPGLSTTRLINFGPDERSDTQGNSKPIWEYRKSDRRRRCFIYCHGKAMVGEIYTPGATGDVDANYP